MAGWTFWEARVQQREVQDELANQAAQLARSLGPGLAAASNAAREIDEVVIWKLLDNARLLAEIGGDRSFSAPQRQRLARIAEANGLDTVAFIDAAGDLALALGEYPSASTVAEVYSLVSGEDQEFILDPILEDGFDHLGVAVAQSGGGGVLVRIHALEARAFTRRLGVQNLLQHIAGSNSVLYLAYDEEPDGKSFAATWDGGEVPAAPSPDERLRLVRGRSIVEVKTPIESRPGASATLRIGLDGQPLRRAATSAMRRTLLVGTALAAFTLAAAAFTLVSWERRREREKSGRRLARAEAARRQSARLAAAGALAAGLAHEVRSPMNAIGLAAQRLERKLPREDERQLMAQRIRGEVKRLDGVLRQFLDLARPVSDARKATNLAHLSREVVELLETEADDSAVRLVPPRADGIVEVDPEAVRRALINLVRNAIQASNAGGRVEIDVEQDRRFVTVTVSDNGSGIDRAIAEEVFEPFVTGRASGTGLGLALVRRVAEEHDGSVELTARPSGGTRADLSFPRAEEA